ncbi:MAG: NADH-quinone oxidoreductase subunit NuoF [Candidatus Eisenbacteria bacterium]|nr:NADH-quinone oxidoreductase subunit NuoF [Candidatus Eisenbacteria bacterium]
MAPNFPLILTKNMTRPDSHRLSAYTASGGYNSWKKTLKELTPDQVIQTVKDSGLRGRGGAGFPCGLKWSFVPRQSEKPKYLACNADESEPGTFKDRMLMTRDPHMLIEGMAIAAFAIDCHLAFIYIRGEFALEAIILENALAEARAAGHLGKNIYGTGYELDMMVYRGAGAYIAGEETGMLESLEGKRAHPRIKPPFPAVVGLYGSPTVINNVETLANVPAIIENGAAWFAAIGTPKSTGTKLMNISGHVNRPGVVELPMGTKLMTIINDYCGGVWHNRKLKAVIPGGSSVPVLTAAECEEVTVDYDSLAAAGTMLGTAAIIVMDETTCMVQVASRLTRFYDEESCGQCTPCREGTAWAFKILDRLVHEGGEPHEIDLLLDICDNMGGRTICALADAAVGPIKSCIEKFRPEFDYAVRHGSPMKGRMADVPGFDVTATVGARG